MKARVDVEKWRPRRKWRRDFPYYKVQVLDTINSVWVDERGAFDSLEEARRYIESRLQGKNARVMVVEANGRHPLLEDPGNP
jgi:hypothetical protein